MLFQLIISFISKNQGYVYVAGASCLGVRLCCCVGLRLRMREFFLGLQKPRVTESLLRSEITIPGRHNVHWSDRE